jgi:hypothetical protein
MADQEQFGVKIVTDGVEEFISYTQNLRNQLKGANEQMIAMREDSKGFAIAAANAKAFRTELMELRNASKPLEQQMRGIGNVARSSFRLATEATEAFGLESKKLTQAMAMAAGAIEVVNLALETQKVLLPVVTQLQLQLDAAMDANPVGAIIAITAAFVAMGAALAYLITDTEKEVNAQKLLNEQLSLYLNETAAIAQNDAARTAIATKSIAQIYAAQHAALTTSITAADNAVNESYSKYLAAEESKREEAKKTYDQAVLTANNLRNERLRIEIEYTDKQKEIDDRAALAVTSNYDRQRLALQQEKAKEVEIWKDNADKLTELDTIYNDKLADINNAQRKEERQEKEKSISDENELENSRIIDAVQRQKAELSEKQRHEREMASEGIEAAKAEGKDVSELKRQYITLTKKQEQEWTQFERDQAALRTKFLMDEQAARDKLLDNQEKSREDLAAAEVSLQKQTENDIASLDKTGVQEENLAYARKLENIKNYFDKVIGENVISDEEAKKLKKLRDNAIEAANKAHNQKLQKDNETTTEKQLELMKKEIQAAKDSVKLLDATNQLANELQADKLKKGETLSIAAQKSAFDRNKALSIANIGIQIAEGEISAVIAAAKITSQAGIPGIAIGAGYLAAEEALIAATGAIEIAAILAKKFEPDSSSSSSSGSKYALGGILDGPSHAYGGIKTSFGELEGHEAVINKVSTSMYKPILSAINVAGGGRPLTNQPLPAAPTPVVKAYVVDSEMSSQQEATKRIQRMAGMNNR